MQVASSGIGLGIAVTAGAAALIALGGCRATTYAAEPVGYVEVTSAPFDVSAYPHSYYDGRDVYYVNDRWMYREGGRWAYYQREPPTLYRQRTYVQQAPPAYPRSYPQPYGGGPYRRAPAVPYRGPMPQPPPGGARPPPSAPPAAPPARRVP